MLTCTYAGFVLGQRAALLSRPLQLRFAMVFVLTCSLLAQDVCLPVLVMSWLRSCVVPPLNLNAFGFHDGMVKHVSWKMPAYLNVTSELTSCTILCCNPELFYMRTERASTIGFS